MNQAVSQIVEKLLLRGCQFDKSAAEVLSLIDDEAVIGRLSGCILDYLDRRGMDQVVLDKSLLEKIAEEVGVRHYLVPSPKSVTGVWKPLASEVDSRVEILRDPTNLIGTEGSTADYANYFRSRFSKLKKILSQRLDSRDAGTIGNALSATQNAQVKFIAMVFDKHYKDGRFIIKVEDQEDSASVLVADEMGHDVFEMAGRVIPDQVVCVQGRRGTNDLVIGEKIVLPDVPEHRPPVTEEEIYCAFISDIHVGNRVFLEKPFERLLRWFNGDLGTERQAEKAGRIKYLIIGGDLVDGVGVYPGQEDDLSIVDVYEQYACASKLIAQVPDHIEVLLIPGNHDATRQSLPQPAIPADFAEAVYEARPVYSLGDPSEVRLHGLRFLLYHGRSLDDVVGTVPNMTFETIENAMNFLLHCRHLAPKYGGRTPIAPEREDMLVVETPPDVLHSGHVHVARHSRYRGCVVINSGTWLAQTEYQVKIGLQPTPAILPILNMHSTDVEMLRFAS